MTMRGRTSEAGYTLMEFLVVLTIMALVAVAAVPMLSASRPGLLAKSAAHAVAQDLAAARRDAITRGAETRVVFAAGRYDVLPGGPSRALPNDIAVRLRGAAEIDFFADGSSNGGIIDVASAHARHSVVTHWPSGRITLDE
jgi:prepilin-type N-terminal cleavage/methylation domain-containing protein